MKHSGLIIIAMISFLIAPFALSGEARTFTPTFAWKEGLLDVDAFNQNAKNTSDGAGLETGRTFISEKFTYTTLGYVYHPRFMVFLGKMSLGMGHEKFTNNRSVSDNAEGSWRTGDSQEYELRTYFLPEHPYKLELYTLRSIPFIRGALLTGGLDALNTSNGAIFKYKKRPYFFLLSYDSTTLESSNQTTDSSTYRMSGSFVQNWGSISGGHSHTGSDTSFSRSGTRSRTVDDNYLGNSLVLAEEKAFLNTNIDSSIASQEEETLTLGDERFSLSEELKVFFPWNFTSEVLFRYSDDKFSTSEPGAAKSILETSGTSMGFKLSHYLYQSLGTSYSFQNNLSESSRDFLRSEATLTSHVISSEYTKKIRKQRLLSGVSFGSSTSDSRGAPVVINEVHTSRAPGEFTLQGALIDEATIVIRVKAPDSGVLFDLTKEVNYQALSLGDTIQIIVFALPQDAVSSDPLFDYEFRVTYSVLPSHFRLRNDSAGFHLGLELFERSLHPYYRFFENDQKVLQGSLPGRGADHTISHTYGLDFTRPSYSISSEYRDFRSEISPSKTFMLEADARKDINKTTNLSGRAHYTRTSYSDISDTGSQGLLLQTSGGGVTLLKKVPRRNISLSFSGSFNRTKGNFTSNNYVLSNAVVWKFAKLDLRAGADFSLLRSEIPSGKSETVSRAFYIRLRRKLF